MSYGKELKMMIREKGFSIPEASEKAEVGTATLYEILRGEYILGRAKLEAILSALDAGVEEGERILALRDEAKRRLHARKPSRRNAIQTERDRGTIIEFLRENGFETRENLESSSCILVRKRGEKRTVRIPILVIQRLDDPESTFGCAVRAMFEVGSEKALVVSTFPAETPKWFVLGEREVRVVTTSELKTALDGMLMEETAAEEKSTGAHKEGSLTRGFA
jgi:hypothetical protein